MVPAKPSLELLRSLSDEHVLRALMARARATRAELATVTGLSKPTVSESVRRLTELGLLVDSGERSTGRGRSGAYYRLADDAGTALAVGIAPEGITLEVVDLRGGTVAAAGDSVPRPSRADLIARQLSDLARDVTAGLATPPRLAVVSAADPVDRATGRLVHLPDAPFLLGALDPVEILTPFVTGPITVDNDVNWAARAERGADLSDFVLLHLGEGLGAAVVTDGEVHRGHGGLAGEIAHVVTEGPGGRAMRFIEVFGLLGLRQPHSTAVDSERLKTLIRDGETRVALARAVTGVIAAVTALADPEVVVLGGAWGSDPLLVEAVRAELSPDPRPVPVRPASTAPTPSFTGARTQALTNLQSLVAHRPPPPTPDPGRSVRALGWGIT